MPSSARTTLPGRLTAALVTGGAGVALLAGLLTAPAQAVPGPFIDAQLESGHAFLANGYTEVGIRPDGTFGSSINAPAGYHPRNDWDNRLGLRADRDKDGWGVGTDDGDFVVPGTPTENWGVQVEGHLTHLNMAQLITAIPGSNSDPVVDDGEVSAVWRSDNPVDGVTIEQATTVPADSTRVEVEVTLTNTTGATIPSVLYSRQIDPDNCRTAVGASCSGSFITTNTVQQLRSAGDPLSLASAEAADGSYLDLRTDAADSVVLLSTPISCELWNIATVFANPASCGLQSGKGATITTDGSLYLMARTGPIAPGDSATVGFTLVLSAAEAAALDSPPTTTTTSTTTTSTTTTTTTTTTTAPPTTTTPTTTTTTAPPPTTTTTPPTTTTTPPPATVPGAPAKVSAKGADRKAAVTFGVPGNGGSAITKYQYRVGTKAWTTVGTRAAGTGSRSFTVTGLSNGTTYSVRVRAVNAVGAGTQSSTVKVFVNSPAPKVSKPKSAVRVPAKPRNYHGPRAFTKARWTSHNGAPAPAIARLDGHALVKGEAATLSKKSVFRFDSATLTKAGRAEAKQLAKRLKAAKAIRCEGYTDYAGPHSNHVKLGTARAKAFCKALKSYGAKVTTTVKNYKGSRPVVVGGKAKTRHENRRVVVLVTADRH